MFFTVFGASASNNLATIVPIDVVIVMYKPGSRAGLAASAAAAAGLALSCANIAAARKPNAVTDNTERKLIQPAYTENVP